MRETTIQVHDVALSPDRRSPFISAPIWPWYATGALIALALALLAAAARVLG